ncbi:MAG: hypothetical protein JO270_24480 [Acidobacteriaceae bacterium]|nr:hypothetical protein [Acidobacteriaceae bacterium]MBV8569308.1 hypothetical protein [Acidobacteriaceae bacterium]
MPRFSSNTRAARRPVHDFQIFKGPCADTMVPFGSPVMAAHEALLMARDDQEKQAPGTAPVYAIYKRSEHRIIRILERAA